MTDEADPLGLDLDAGLSRAARAFAPDALAVFANAVRTSDDERVRVTAAKAILDLGYGRAEVPSQPSSTNSDDPIPDEEFWASWTDGDLTIHLLEVTRELRARGLEDGARYYSREFGIPLIASPPEPQAQAVPERPVADAEPQHDQLDLRLEPPPEPEPIELDLEETTPRSPTPGPGEMLIDCPGKLTVPYIGHVFHLKQGVQVVSNILADHHVVRRFIVKEDDAA